MKLVKITNATVVPFYHDKNDTKLEIIRVLEKKPEFNSQMVLFNVETKVDDNNPMKKARLFERCTIYAKTDADVEKIQKTITNGLLVEIEGRETRVPGKENPKTGKTIYYNNVVVKNITPISSEVVETSTSEDDLPF